MVWVRVMLTMVGTVGMWMSQTWFTHYHTLQAFGVFILTNSATLSTSPQTWAAFIAIGVATGTPTSLGKLIIAPPVCEV